jgi:RNA polymerase sigma-70 factor (ECF subfamily)
LKADFKSFVEPDTELYLDDSLEKEQQLRQMEKAIEELDGDQKTCIDLFYLKEKSYMEIVEITGYSLNSVKSHLQNGKRNIRIFLGR